MKNKKTAYILAPIVLFVWGMIGWKVYAAINKNETKKIITGEITDQNSTLKTVPDTYSLIVDYRDPFLDKPIVHEPAKLKIDNSKLPVVKEKEIKPVDILWPEVTYHGLIMRHVNEKKIGFLAVNGASYFVQEGDVAASLKIGKLSKDSVEVFMGNERRVVRK